MNTLVTIKDNTPVISSIDLANGLGLNHNVVIKNIRKHWQKLQQIRASSFQNQKSEGRDTIFCYLDEAQALVVGMMSRNTDIVMDFKVKLAVAFVEANKKLQSLEKTLPTTHQEKLPDWHEARSAGKAARSQTTYIIKEFVNYATAQGSSSASKYYMNITKMQNQALFLVTQKYTNLREILDARQLGLMSTADTIVAKAIEQGMEDGLYYKDIYKLAKEKILTLAELHGKSEVLHLPGSTKTAIAA